MDNKENLEFQVKNSLEKKKVYFVIKRIFDVLFSFLMLAPLAFLSIIIKTVYLFSSEDGPLFYTQKRVGKEGKEFLIIKYRTMTPDAEKELNSLLENDRNKTEWQEYHKFEKDPRITPIGVFLRKTSIDEFPQFINVLKGDMSIIGPRPLVPGELELHGGLPLYYQIKPGITGWWACNGRSILSYAERLEYEYYYVKNASLWLDIRIFFKTIKCVFFKTGAK